MEEREQVNQNTSFAVDLKEIFGVLLKFVWLIVALAVIGGAAAFVKVQFMTDDTYTTNGVLFVRNTAVEDDGSVTTGDLSSGKTFAVVYLEILTTRKFLNKVSEQTGGKYSAGQIASVMQVSLKQNMLLSVTVTTNDPQMSYDIAKAVMDASPVLAEMLGGGYVEVVDEPYKPSKNAKDFVRPMLLGVGAGILLALAVVFVIHTLDTKVRKSEDVAKRYNLPILGELLLMSERAEK